MSGMMTLLIGDSPKFAGESLFFLGALADMRLRPPDDIEPPTAGLDDGFKDALGDSALVGEVP